MQNAERGERPRFYSAFIIHHSALGMKLVVGLGNPGKEYSGTRHNIGFEVLDVFAARNAWLTSPGDFGRVAKEKFEALTLDGVVTLGGGGTERVLLLKPMTYMNLSG